MNLPRKVDDLIDLLDRSFPLRTHPADAPIENIQREYGARDVIDFLRRLQVERDENIAEHLGVGLPRDE